MGYKIIQNNDLNYDQTQEEYLGHTDLENEEDNWIINSLAKDE